eukprot:SAG11_NODE_22719_length_401_cov_0.850993_1_plen_67_part_10
MLKQLQERRAALVLSWCDLPRCTISAGARTELSRQCPTQPQPASFRSLARRRFRLKNRLVSWEWQRA